MLHEEMVTISVPRRMIPQGAELVEAYETASEIIVMGDPPAEDEQTGATYHSCNWMGCGSVGAHVLYRFKKKEMFTDKTPKQPGWYWVRITDNKPWAVELVLLRHGLGLSIGVLAKDLASATWCGPFEPPTT